MRRKKRLAWVILGVAMISLGGIAFQVYRSLALQKESTIDVRAIEGMLPDAVQWIQDFHRIEIQDGRKVWEVEGDEAQYLEESKQVLVRGPRASLYFEDGGVVTVKGGEGVLHLEERDLREVNLKGNVEIRFRDFVIRAPGAVYRRDTEKIVAEGPIQINGDRLQVEGANMVVFVKDSKMQITKDVRVSVLPPKQDPAPAGAVGRTPKSSEKRS